MISKESTKNKVFCIGFNKTGTTSLEKVLIEFGYKMGNQAEAELLTKEYGKYNWDPIIEFCKTADAFQDAPFSWPYTWVVLYYYFPDAKYILTYRSAEKWYKSITSFHSKLFANSKRKPTKEDLQNANYRYKGLMWDVNRAIFKTPENDVYNKAQLLQVFNNHNQSILHFFKGNPNFLAIDVSEKGSYTKVSNFLGHEPIHFQFPHLNKTKPVISERIKRRIKRSIGR